MLTKPKIATKDKASVKLDRLVAQIMGYGILENYPGQLARGGIKTPAFSSNLEDAWDVWEISYKWRELLGLDLNGMLVSKDTHGNYEAYEATGCADPDFGKYYAVAETAPLAICLAALQVFGVEVDES